MAINTDMRREITRAILSIAHIFDHRAVAEGVECEEQLQYLRNCGCDMVQGFLIGRPLDDEAAIDMLKKHPPFQGGS
ncbi:MAG: EAL domain-containing protein [Christensenellales bacterium]